MNHTKQVDQVSVKK